MGKLIFDANGERFYETGVNECALYPQAANGSYPAGVAWNGISNITEKPSGAEASPIYADNIKYLNLYSAETFGATVQAYYYPDEFALCDGSAELATGVMIGQQNRAAFGLAYKTRLGNDIENNDLGYKLHLLYGCKASPSEKAYATINDSPEAIQFSWELTTVPVTVTGFKPTACVIIDSTKVNATKLTQFEDIIYGSTTYSYTKTSDVAIDPTKTYYTKNGDVYTPVAEPVVADIGDYYERTETETTARLPLPDEVASFFATT